MLGEQTLRVALDNGQTVTLTNYLTDTHNILATVGMRVVVCVDAPEGVEPYYTLYQYDRTAGVVVILAIFLVLMLLVGGEKGAHAALALTFSMDDFIISYFTTGALPFRPSTRAVPQSVQDLPLF